MGPPALAAGTSPRVDPTDLHPMPALPGSKSHQVRGSTGPLACGKRTCGRDLSGGVPVRHIDEPPVRLLTRGRGCRDGVAAFRHGGEQREQHQHQTDPPAWGGNAANPVGRRLGMIERGSRFVSDRRRGMHNGFSLRSSVGTCRTGKAPGALSEGSAKSADRGRQVCRIFFGGAWRGNVWHSGVGARARCPATGSGSDTLATGGPNAVRDALSAASAS